MALTRPAQFSPGSAMERNTNYVIAGLLIEAVTGAPAADEISRRVIEPHGLADTYFPAAGGAACGRRSRMAMSWRTAVAPTSPPSMHRRQA